MLGIVLFATGIMFEVMTAVHYFKYWDQMSAFKVFADIAIMFIFGLILGAGLLFIIRSAVAKQ